MFETITSKIGAFYYLDPSRLEDQKIYLWPPEQLQNSGVTLLEGARGQGMVRCPID